MKKLPSRPIAAALFVLTALVYSPVLHFDFVNFDDPDYITGNPHVLSGLTGNSLGWALTSTEAANWLPLTRLSELLDVQLFGVNAGAHHAMNVFYHALATLFLFLFLGRATGARWPSAFVAFVFGLHPLHVESVAWISERKDVLCALFSVVSLHFWALWTQKKSSTRYVAALIAFVLALLSKPMAVSLPLVLVLLDYWPLKRPIVAGLKEKLPFGAIAVGFSAVTFWTQQSSGAVREFANFPLGLRIENAIESYAIYILQMFWPAKLSVFYPYPQEIAAWKLGLSILVIAGITTVAIMFRRTRPYLLTGWLWYLVTLVPVIGLVQVGAQAHADRYTYFTITGLSIMIAWTLQDVPAGLIVLAAPLAILTFFQIQYWENSETLFRHAAAVTERNYLAEHNLGVALATDPNRLADAIQHYRAALAIEPNSARAHTDLGTALARIPEMLPEAVSEYQAALRILPDNPIPHSNLANALSQIAGRLPEAIAEYQTALRLKPDYDEARSNVAVAYSRYGLELAKAGRASDAVPQLEAALRIRSDAETENNLGVVLTGLPGRDSEAERHFLQAVKLDPNYPDARVNLGIALAKTGRKQEAIQQLKTALRLRGDPEVEALVERLK